MNHDAELLAEMEGHSLHFGIVCLCTARLCLALRESNRREDEERARSLRFAWALEHCDAEARALLADEKGGEK